MSLLDCAKGWHENEGDDVCVRCGEDLNGPLDDEPSLEEKQALALDFERQLGEALDILSDLRDSPMSEEMAARIDRLLNAEDDDDPLVTRQAPQWAWNTIDETLAMDAQSSSFGEELRADIQKAIEAVKDVEPDNGLAHALARIKSIDGSCVALDEPPTGDTYNEVLHLLRPYLEGGKA